MDRTHGVDLRGTNLKGSFLVGAKLSKAYLKNSLLTRVYLESADFRGVRHLDQARGVEDVASWQDAKIERKWVERLGPDAERLRITVVDNLDPE